MTQAPLSWITQVEYALSTLTEIPLWGFSPPFPWEVCSVHLGKLLELPELALSHKQTEMRNGGQLLSGLGESPYHTSLALTPLAGTVHWFIPQADVAKLTQLMLSAHNGVKGFSSPKFQEGFYRYLSLKVLQTLDELNSLEDLSLKIAPPEELPTTSCLCIDVAIKHPKLSFWGRLVCPPQFMHAFKAHFSTKTTSLQDSALSKKLDVPLKLEVGHAQLKLNKWSKMTTGDVLILERCTYDPETHKGTATVVLEQTPLFRARIKEDHLKIIDYAYYHEEENNMDHNSDDEDEDMEDFEEEEYDEEDDLDDDEDLDDEDDEDLDEEDEEEDLDDDEDDLDEEDEEDLDEEEEKASSDSQAPLSTEPTPSEELTETAVATAQIPLTITVEVARLKMNVEKVLEMTIGNLIELPVRPEQGVHLVINGKRVARGELVKIGEMLGVKILHIGQ